MAIRKNDAIIIGILVASNVLMPFLGQMLRGQHPIVTVSIQMLVVGGMIGGLVLRNFQLTVQANTYDGFRALIDPPGTVVDLAVRRGWKRETHQNPGAPWLNVTPIEFAEEMKIEPYGEHIKRAHISHLGVITDRLVSGHTKDFKFKGDEVEHNTVYDLVLWQNDMYPVSQEESREEPNWILVTASKADRSNRSMKTRTLAMALGLDKRFDYMMAKQPKNVKELFAKKNLQIERLTGELIDKDMHVTQLVEATEHWRISAINKDGRLESANQEITGMVEDELNVKKAGERRLESKITNIEDVFQLGKEKNWLSKLDIKWLAIGAIGIITLLFLWMNPQILEGFSSWLQSPFTLVLLIVVGAIVVAIVYYLAKIIRGEKT